MGYRFTESTVYCRLVSGMLFYIHFGFVELSCTRHGECENIALRVANVKPLILQVLWLWVWERSLAAVLLFGWLLFSCHQPQPCTVSCDCAAIRSGGGRNAEV